MSVRILAVACTHAHVLVRVGIQDAKPVIGRAKQASSFAVRERMPGTIWAQGCHVVRIEDEHHYRWVVAYIERHQGEGAAIWRYPEERLARFEGDVGWTPAAEAGRDRINETT